MADNEKGKTYRYEGEASFDIILFGLGGTTTHGVRFTDSDMFIGATAGYYSCYSNEFILASVQPKWYFADNDKRDIYISCDIGAAYMFSGSYKASSPLYHYYVETLNAAFVPRIGIGFKTRGRLPVDLWVTAIFIRGNTHFGPVAPGEALTVKELGGDPVVVNVKYESYNFAKEMNEMGKESD